MLHSLFKAFIVAALCEEGLKLMIVRKHVYHHKKFDEIMDGIVYTVTASMGFACLENILYVLDRGIGVAVLRAITAVPMHAFCSGIMDYYIGKAKFSSSKREEWNLILKGLLIAVAIHGTYDFFIFAKPIFGSLLKKEGNNENIWYRGQISVCLFVVFPFPPALDPFSLYHPP